MYLVYESLYGDLLCECDSTNIIGLYDSLEKAKNRVNEIIKNESKSNDYVLDNQTNNLDEDSYVRFFFGNQENWNCYYEVIIEKVECE